MNLKYIKSLLCVAFASSCYGMVAIFVRLAYQQHYHTAEIIISQALIGFLGLFLIYFISKNKYKNYSYTKKDILKLMICGCSFAFTNTFFYQAVRLGIPVAICTVLLMQAVWMGSVVDFIVNKKKPSIVEIIAILTILVGTFLATNILEHKKEQLNFSGLTFGFLAAVSYTFSLFSTNKISVNVPPTLRPACLLFGASLMVSLIWSHELVNEPFHPSIFYKYGLIIAFFGTILATFLFSSHMPVVGIGVGSIVASLELPTSVIAAKIILSENINYIQWMGILLILLSVVFLNIPLLRSNKTSN
ncbi:EamA/RhaT family transporter [Apibacter muscae]|uniref:EamA/RhaT family transporter n=1 Tax=Apibacter muscae TaxID=2509004 RepID=A0A563D914_9FLAO|nr:DMT family transporter [Apibacter muscae]TWP26778.1 EamA/RhaT family transporter [Apibacter muscae]